MEARVAQCESKKSSRIPEECETQRCELRTKGKRSCAYIKAHCEPEADEEHDNSGFVGDEDFEAGTSRVRGCRARPGQQFRR
eukprot:2063239-Amphidinium_carterae.2